MTDTKMGDSEAVPEDIEHILSYLADMAAAYSTGLKWNEEAKLKADLMNNPVRWRNVSAQAVSQRLLSLGMSPEDTRTLTDFVKRAQAGKRLVPQKTYRDFKFN